MSIDLGRDAQRDAAAVPRPTPAHTAAPPAPAPNRLAADWRRRYQRRLWISDSLALVWVVFGAQIAWFGTGSAQLAISEDARLSPVSYWSFSAALILVWLLVLWWNDSRSDRVIGAGPTEYVRVADGSLRVFGAVAIVAFLTKTDVARGFLIISLPAGILVLVLERWLWRQWLISMRAKGEYSARVLLVGSDASVVEIGRELKRARSAGYLVVGACTPHGGVGTLAGGIPILGTVDDVERAMAVAHADTVAVTSTDDLPPQKVKQISWLLRPGEQHLVLAPSIVDIAGPRLHTRPVAGLPLIHVETPRFSRGQAFIKRAVDIVGAGLFIVVTSPLLILIAVAVRLSSPGPILYRSERIGAHGKPFMMLKFRSMQDGADAQLHELLKAQGTAETPLFKIKDDPRITPVGRFLRRYSLDELPQFFNVLGGSMSLVGPRPQVAAEVALYDDAARLPLLLKPGISGLWQVSGRSALSWDEAVRLDLSYVENWTLLADFVILAKTVRAVLRPGDTAA